MKTVITITIENPTPETLNALLQGNANKQTAIIKTSVKAEKPKHNSLKGKKPIVADKICIICHHKFTPRSNRQEKCDDCKLVMNHGSKVMQSIDDTLEEIKRSQNKPYEFTK